MAVYCYCSNRCLKYNQIIGITKFSIENLVKNNRIFMLWFEFFVIPLCPLSPIEGFFNN